MTTIDLAQDITDRIRRVTGGAAVALHEPIFLGNESAYVQECIATGWVSSVGKFVDRFERDLADVTGAQHAVVVSNGTSGLHVALYALGVGAGDEVIVPALSFVATANAVRHCGAEPHFADVDPATLGMSVPALAGHLDQVAVRRGGVTCNRHTGKRIAAVVPMHAFGHPVDMPALVDLAERHGIPVVEDAAESLGSLIGTRHTGTFGRCGMLSFNGNKIVTTGGGGAILTNDGALAKRLKHLTTTAKLPHPWDFVHDEVAFNYRMPNLNAALGCAQLEQLERFVAAKRELARRYAEAFADLSGATLWLERAGTRANYWLQVLILDRSVACQRDEVLSRTNAAGQMTRPVWTLLTQLPMFRACPAMDTPVSIDLAGRIVNMPSSPQLVAGLRP